MSEPRTVGDRFGQILDPDQTPPTPAPVPLTICALCHQRVTVNEGTHRVIDGRWHPVHRGLCPEPAA